MEHLFKGKHLLLDLTEISGFNLTNTSLLKDSLTKAIKKSKSTIVGYSDHLFEDNTGFTCVFLLAESHVSLHTYPEVNSLFLDAFTCGDIDPQIIIDEFLKIFPNYKKQLSLKERGVSN